MAKTNIRERMYRASPMWKAMVSRMDAIITLANDLRTKYEAHRILTAGSVHGAADSTNVISAPAVSTLDQV